jgi:serine/threonine protein kinase
MIDSLIGRRLGDYVIQELLGRGGMARVYRGYDERLQRYAAIKVISGDFNAADQAEYTERFRREARSIARLNHPNIVGIYQFGEIDSMYYMAQVFIEGRDLRHILKSYGERGVRMKIPEVMNIARGIATGLDYAHGRGVIHRDVKPSNIMIDSDDRPVLTDFGLALNAAEGTLGDTFGSAHYIAPEQAVSSARAVPQSDLYSLAICIYEMLTGKVPFDDPSAMSVALKHLNDPPPSPRMWNPELSPAVERVLLKALDKDPTRRYATGGLLVQALELAVTKDEVTEAADASQSRIGDIIKKKSTGTLPVANSTANEGSRPSRPSALSSKWRTPDEPSNPVSPSRTGQIATPGTARTGSQVGSQTGSQIKPPTAASRPSKTTIDSASQQAGGSRRGVLFAIMGVIGVMAVLSAILLVAQGQANNANGTPTANDQVAVVGTDNSATEENSTSANPTENPTGEPTPTDRPTNTSRAPITAQTEQAATSAAIQTSGQTTEEPTPSATNTRRAIPTTAAPTSTESAATVSAGEPTAEPTTAPTTEATTEPTIEPTTEPTIEPTIEPTSEASAESGVVGETPSATGAPPDVVLLYDEDQFNLVNVSRRNLVVTLLSFRQPAPDGGEDRFFTATRWRVVREPFSPDWFPSGWCLQLGKQQGRVVPLPNTSECNREAGFFLTNETGWFWIPINPGDTDATFLVFQDNEQIAECSITAGRCEFRMR